VSRKVLVLGVPACPRKKAMRRSLATLRLPRLSGCCSGSRACSFVAAYSLLQHMHVAYSRPLLRPLKQGKILGCS
jgi:hypothetical protein